MKRKFFLLGLCLLALFALPATGLAWTTPTYTDIWSEPTYTDIWTVPEYTDIWTEDDIVYYELEEGSVRVTVTPSARDSYYVLYRSTDFNDFVEYAAIATPYFDDPKAYANHTYIYLFAAYDSYDNLIGYSNYVAVKVLPKKQPKPVTPAPTPTSPTQSSTIELQINNRTATVGGVQKSLTVAPISQNNRTLVPIRFISEAMGAKVDWNSTEKKVTIHLDGNTIILWIGKTETLVGGKKVYLDVPANVINSTTFVPIRFLSENFGREVTYDNATRKITIKAGAANNSNNSGTVNTNNNFLVGTWDLWVPGGFDSYTGYYSPGAGGDTLQIKNDGTFVWNAVDGKVISGKWKQNGSSITILGGRYDWDWNVSETQFSDGKGIKVSTTGVYYEGRKR